MARARRRIDDMPKPLLTILDKPYETAEKSADLLGVLRTLISLPIFLVALPFILIALPISVVYTWLVRLKVRRFERKFAENMKAVGRAKPWTELIATFETSPGTVIVEHPGKPGGGLTWWTPEDILSLAPHKFDPSVRYPWLQKEFVHFFRWCIDRYTDPLSGRAVLIVNVPKGAIPESQKIFPATRWVHISSARWVHRAAPSLQEVKQ
jgi:hypothetical protein